jgi:hypothetical protein
LIAVSSNRLSIPGVHLRRLRLLCITALISSSNPVAGALLAVPMLATFKIFCDRIEPLKRIGSFLGRT